MVERERFHVRVAFEQGVDGSTQITDPFSVNDPDLENAFLAAGIQIIGNEILDLFGTKGVQVKHAIDWELDRLVH